MTGSHSLSVLTHVAEDHRHASGNATTPFRPMEENLAQEITLKLVRVTLKYVQVVRFS